MSDAFHYFRAHAVQALCKARSMIKEGSEAGAKPPPPTLTVVVDWLAELKQRFPNR